MKIEIDKAPNLLTNGFVKTSSSDGTLSVDTATYMANPMTTGGDVIYGGASGTPTRLANGTVGQVLTSGGTTVAPTWTTIVAGGGSNAYAFFIS